MQDVVTIRAVEKSDLGLLDTALRSLSDELGDKHAASIELLEQAGFGPTPAYYAQIALSSTSNLCGAVVFSPLMSTTLGATGFYVSDLWVANTARGCGLGRRLLAHAAKVAKAKWGADYLKLAVYDGAVDARRFYDALGLTARKGETTMLLKHGELDTLRAKYL